MEPGGVVAWGASSGVVALALAWGVGQAPSGWLPARVVDFYILVWHALAATGFLAAAYAAALALGAFGLPLLETLRIGASVAFVVAMASLVAATANLVSASAGVKAVAPAR